MTLFIIISTVVLVTFGLGVSAWSLISTRKKYYEEYISRKGIK